jgi:dTDP-4-amino-4,6-dideoxygalactose transaminase
MIPRFKPALGVDELKAALSFPKKDDFKKFEAAFAELMDQKYALAFPYGRTGLILLLEALGLKNREIICPAYTCVVVPHAIVFSKNIPVFVDCEINGFNMDLDQVSTKITPRTGAIIATSLFGYSANLDKLDKIRKDYPDVYIIQDCAHSFAAKWNGRAVQKEGIAALFGLNISKTLTSVFGGMITTDNEDIYQKLKTIRDQKLNKPNWNKSFRRMIYFLTVYPTFWGPVYGLINRLERLGLLNYFVQYYDDTKIDMPSDYLEEMCGIEARVGTANIDRYETIIDKRAAAAKYYFERLTDKPDFSLPPEVEGATYSHFVVKVDDRDKWLQRAIRKGIQLGWLIEYNIPEMEAYGSHRPEEFPVAAAYSKTMINLPTWGGAKLGSKIILKLHEPYF